MSCQFASIVDDFAAYENQHCDSQNRSSSFFGTGSDDEWESDNGSSSDDGGEGAGGPPTAGGPGGDLPESDSRVISVTADFSMQNVILQMGLRLVAPNGQRVTRLSRWVLRCSACTHISKVSPELLDLNLTPFPANLQPLTEIHSDF